MRYRLLNAGGAVLDEGDGEVTVENGHLFVTQADLAVAAASLTEVAETVQPYGLRLTLTDGAVLELTMLGRMRGRLFAELGDARAGLAGGGVGRPEIFPAEVDGVRGEVRLFEDCLVTLPTAERVPFSFIDTVAVAGYGVTIEVTGRADLVVSALGRRTTEFAGLLGDRRQDARKRTSAFLGALLPDLGPMALRSLAMILRDGRAGSPAELDGVDPAIRPALLSAVTHPECVLDPAALGSAWIGFTQIGSVRKEAVGVQPWQDSAAAPRLNDHGGDGGGFGAMAGAAAMSQGFGGPFGAMGPALAYGMLGFGATPGSRSMTPRANVQRGLLTPAHDDLTALTVTGDDPTILAFALTRTSGDQIIHQLLNRPGHPRREFQATDIRAVNLLIAREA